MFGFTFTNFKADLFYPKFMISAITLILTYEMCSESGFIMFRKWLLKKELSKGKALFILHVMIGMLSSHLMQSKIINCWPSQGGTSVSSKVFFIYFLARFIAIVSICLIRILASRPPVLQFQLPVLLLVCVLFVLF